MDSIYLPPELIYMILSKVDIKTYYNCLLANSVFGILSPSELVDKKIKYCIRKSSYSRRSPYVYAIQQDWLDVIEALYERGYFLCHPSLDGFIYKDDLYAATLLYERPLYGKWLIAKGYVPSEKSLYQCIVDKDLNNYRDLYENFDIGGNIIRFHYEAINHGALEILKYIKQEMNLVPHIQYGLVTAVKSLSLDMVKYVWEHVGKTKDSVIRNYFPMAISYAIILNAYEILDFLLDKNIPINLTAFHGAIRKGDIEMINYLRCRNRLCSWATINDLIMLWNSRGKSLTERMAKALAQHNCQIYGFDRISMNEIDDELLKILEKTCLMENTTFFNI